VRNPAMPKFDQVLGRKVRAMPIIGVHSIEALNLPRNTHEFQPPAKLFHDGIGNEKTRGNSYVNACPDQGIQG
jgi:hypothetical protein